MPPGCPSAFSASPSAPWGRSPPTPTSGRGGRKSKRWVVVAVGPAPGDAPRHSRAGQQVSAGSCGGVGGPLTPPAASSLREEGLSGRLSLGSRSAGRRRRPRLHPRSPRCVPACGPALPAPVRLRLPPSRCCRVPPAVAPKPGPKAKPREGWQAGNRFAGRGGLEAATVGRKSGAGPPALPMGRPGLGRCVSDPPRVREAAGHGSVPVPRSRQRSCPGLSGGAQVRCSDPEVSPSDSGSCGSLFSGIGCLKS